MQYDDILARAKEHELEDPEAGPYTCLKLAMVEAILANPKIGGYTCTLLMDQIFKSRGWQIYHVVRQLTN